MTTGIYKRKNSEEIKKILNNLVCNVCKKKYKLKTPRSLKYLKTRKFCSLTCYFKSEENKRTIFKKGHKADKRLLNQTDERNCMWKGDNVGYFALHKWIIKKYGNPLICEECGKEGEKINGKWTIEWSNINHKYKRYRKDYKGRCGKCHRLYDKKF